MVWKTASMRRKKKPLFVAWASCHSINISIMDVKLGRHKYSELSQAGKGWLQQGTGEGIRDHHTLTS